MSERAQIDSFTVQQLRESLVAYGAPLAGDAPCMHLPLEDALIGGIQSAQTDGTFLRVLPIVLAKQFSRLNWRVLKDSARLRNLQTELGLLVELTAYLIGKPELVPEVEDLREHLPRDPRYFPVAHNDFERRLAEERTPDVARRWGFFMNMSIESFKSSLVKHAP